MEFPGGPPWNVASSYAVLRFTLGASFLLHGVSRLVSGWSAFAEQMVQSFQNTFLPEFLVRPFALSVPPVEAVLGTLLCLGLFTRWTLIAGGLWMLALVFGTTIRQDYPTVAIQLLYALLLFVLQV
jgi:thiosulfate dehydrogenase [quinone] large subunit